MLTLYSLILLISFVFLVATFIVKIPFIEKYQLFAQMIAAILVVASSFLIGMKINEQRWEVKVGEYNEQIAELKTKSAEVKTEIVEKVITKREYIKQKGKTVTEYIDREVVKYDQTCKIPSEFVQAHNEAAKK